MRHIPNDGHRADMSAQRGNEKMDVVIFAALPFVTDKESRAPIGCAAQISTAETAETLMKRGEG